MATVKKAKRNRRTSQSKKVRVVKISTEGFGGALVRFRKGMITAVTEDEAKITRLPLTHRAITM
jgi:hypothetical protein